MTNLNPEICRKIRDARREARISQSVLAKEVGCFQSALSAFEQGDGTKLNDEVIERLAKKFSIDLKEEPKVPERSVPLPTPQEISRAVFPTALVAQAFCPNPKCPSNHVYLVEDRAFALPDRKAADPVGGKFCAVCGELLERKCPTCGAPVHEGAVCSLCGERYVVV